MEMRFSDSRPAVPGDRSPGLRPIGWSELCARLVAAHDTRGVLAGAGLAGIATPADGLAVVNSGDTAIKQGSPCGSFHSSAATLLGYVEMQTEEPVNPASLANGNDAEGKQASGPNFAPQRRPDENRHD